MLLLFCNSISDQYHSGVLTLCKIRRSYLTLMDTPVHRFCTGGDFRFYTSRGRACPHLSDSPCSTCPGGCNWMSLSWGRWGTSCSAAVCCTAQSPSLRKCLKRTNAIDFYSIDNSTYFSTFKSDTVSNIVIHLYDTSQSFNSSFIIWGIYYSFVYLLP